jgi:hypothetical protein
MGRGENAKPEGEVGAYAKKVGSGDNVTEATKRKHARDSVAGDCQGGRGGTDEDEKPDGQRDR